MRSWSWVLALLVPVAAAAGPPVVEITHPAGGWSTERKVTVAGTVSDPKIQRARLSLNGTDFLIRVDHGGFRQKLVLSRGLNTVVVEADNPDGTGRDAVSFHSTVPNVDLKIYLIFDPQPFYIDLWVTEPDGSKCYWRQRTTDNGGILHDLYNDLPGGGVGMGPQAYTAAAAAAGDYLIQVNYWAGGAWGAGEVDGGPYGTRRLPIVPVRVECVLYEGTDQEERHGYHAVLTKPSDTYTLGRLRVRPPDQRPDAAGKRSLTAVDRMKKKAVIE